MITLMGSFVLVIQPIFYVLESSQWYESLTRYKELEQEDPEHIENVGEVEGNPQSRSVVNPA